MIVEDEQKGRRKAEYGKKTLEALSARLTVVAIGGTEINSTVDNDTHMFEYGH